MEIIQYPSIGMAAWTKTRVNQPSLAMLVVLTVVNHHQDYFYQIWILSMKDIQKMVCFSHTCVWWFWILQENKQIVLLFYFWNYCNLLFYGVCNKNDWLKWIFSCKCQGCAKCNVQLVNNFFNACLSWTGDFFYTSLYNWTSKNCHLGK